jgi:hypothetical protein
MTWNFEEEREREMSLKSKGKRKKVIDGENAAKKQ